MNRRGVPVTRVNDRGIAVDRRTKPLEVSVGEFSVGQDGMVIVDGQNRGQIQVVGELDPDTFEPVGGGVYRYSRAGMPSASTATIRQFFLERSNVHPVQEMVRLVQSQRAYEANMQMIRLQDRTMEQGVSQIARIVGDRDHFGVQFRRPVPVRSVATQH